MWLKYKLSLFRKETGWLFSFMQFIQNLYKIKIVRFSLNLLVLQAEVFFFKFLKNCIICCCCLHVDTLHFRTFFR